MKDFWNQRYATHEMVYAHSPFHKGKANLVRYCAKNDNNHKIYYIKV
jgi:hypothetical protein